MFWGAKLTSGKSFKLLESEHEFESDILHVSSAVITPTT
jgi:hypothetical protein